MKDVNVVLEGREKGLRVRYFSGTGYGFIMAVKGGWPYTKEYIKNYTILDETTKEEFSVVDGIMGQMFFGDMGFLAGSNGIQTKEYLVAVEWKDGEKSLVCFDHDLYKRFMRAMF